MGDGPMSGLLEHLCGISEPRVLVFGMTGRQGRRSSRLMTGFGTRILAGCTPGKGGQEVDGTPVFDNAAEALERFPDLNAAVLFVPARAVLSAASEALEAGIKFLVVTADGVPTHDAIVVAERARPHQAKFLGPNTVGMVDTSGYLFGMLGGRTSWARKSYQPGCIGVISRSGGLSQLLGAFHCRPHLPAPRPDGTYGPVWGEQPPGVSAVVCIGGDPVPGVSMLDAARAFQADTRTRVIAVYGETGTRQENDLAGAVAAGEITKPVVVFLGGKFTKSGVAQSHAGAIVRAEADTYSAKRRLLEEAGAAVVERPDAVFGRVASLLGLLPAD
ncbi:succinate--CoA ligase subunit alpha [Candidatus Fermentibacteria bacterium]|nr:succinate--CoA ligase subunit alpha [Candidatus Fermentibacteria bacterium]